jgi:hypothetical protein
MVMQLQPNSQNQVNGGGNLLNGLLPGDSSQVNTTNSSSGNSSASIAPVPVGQTPLTTPPQWGGAGGGQQAAQVYAFNQFQKTFGRNPSQQELDQLTPAYVGTDPNIANVAGGNAQVAAYFQQQTNTPQNIYQQQQNQYLQQAPKFADQVNGIFQSQLGRDATADEKSHFGALIASGQDPYQVQQALQQTQEYQNTANTKFQQQLGSQLQGTNADYFQKYIMPGIQAQNAQAGRTQDSSGYQAQLANAALQQNQGLQNFLAQTTAQNYQNSTANAANQYQQLMGQQYGLQNANVSSGLANQAANTQYNQNLDMYQRQQTAYNNYLNQYGKRNGLINDIGTGLNFANAALNLGRGGVNAFGSGSSSGGGSSGFGGGPPQGSNYYNGSNNNPSNYGINSAGL